MRPRIDDLKVKTRDPRVLLPFLVEEGSRAVIPRMKPEGLIDAEFDVESVPKMTNGAETAEREAPAGDMPPKPMAPRECKYPIIRDLKALNAWIGRAMKGGSVAVSLKTASSERQSELVAIS